MDLRNSRCHLNLLVLREILMTNDTTAMTTGVDAGDYLAISESVRYATIVVATVPILLIYPFIQKYFVEGHGWCH